MPTIDPNAPVTAPNFTAFANTFNQTQAADGLLQFDLAGNTDIESALLSLNATDLASSFDAVSGEIHADAAAGAAGVAEDFGQLLTSMAVGGGSSGVVRAALGVPPSGLATLSSRTRDELPSARQLAEQAGAPEAAIYGADLVLGDPVPPVVADPLLANGPTVWFGGLGGRAEVDADGNADGYDLTTYGVGMGIEQDLSALTGMRAMLGAGIGYTSGDLALSARIQDVEIDTYHIGLYGTAGAGRMEGGFSVRGAVSYAFHDFDTSRTIAFGIINRTATASYDGHTISGDFEGRYNIALDLAALPGRTVLSPFARLQLGRSKLDGFAETGAGSLNLTGGASDFEQSTIAVGASFSGDYAFAGGLVWKPTLSVAYERLTGDAGGTATVGLAGSPTAFAVRGTQEARDRLRIGTVSEFLLTEQARVTFATDSVYSSDRTDYSAKAGLKLQF